MAGAAGDAEAAGAPGVADNVGNAGVAGSQSVSHSKDEVIRHAE